MFRCCKRPNAIPPSHVSRITSIQVQPLKQDELRPPVIPVPVSTQGPASTFTLPSMILAEQKKPQIMAMREVFIKE